MNNISVNLKNALHNSRMSSSQLAKLCGTTARNVNRHLADSSTIKVDTLEQYAIALDIDLFDLIGTAYTPRVTWCGIDSIDDCIHAITFGMGRESYFNKIMSYLHPDYLCMSNHYNPEKTPNLIHVYTKKQHGFDMWGMTREEEMSGNRENPKDRDLDGRRTHSVSNVFFVDDYRLCIHQKSRKISSHNAIDTNAKNDNDFNATNYKLGNGSCDSESTLKSRRSQNGSLSIYVSNISSVIEFSNPICSEDPPQVIRKTWEVIDKTRTETVVGHIMRKSHHLI